MIREYRFGKKPARIDKRTLPFKRLIMGLPDIPETFDLDTYRNIPARMMCNDRYGNCVIVGRANHTLRFEFAEQGKIINITDKEVLREYFKEGGANCLNKYPDRGLVMLDSLNQWRQAGWIADGRLYNIYAFAGIDITQYYLRAAMFLLNGINIGLSLPDNYATDIWDDTSLPPNINNGHCVYIPPIADNEGLFCITWGMRKRMSWPFVLKYCDEAYAIVDNKNKFQCDSNINIRLLESYLEALKR